MSNITLRKYRDGELFNHIFIHFSLVKNSLDDFQKAGGLKKLKAVTNNDIGIVRKWLVEFVKNDVYRSIRKTVRNTMDKLKDGR
jgi:hypothetical protein